jgi:hypothetical protein
MCTSTTLRSERLAPSTLRFGDGLEGVRNKLLNSVFWDEPQPRTPETFALHAANVLNHDDFHVLDEFEALVGERVACAWLDDAISEAGYAQRQAA